MTRRVSKEFRIPYTGLKTGKYHFDYNLEGKFFDAFDYSEINSSNIVVAVDMEKQSTLMLLNFTLSGSVMVSCDRCGDPIEQPIHLKEQLVVKFGDKTLGDDGEFLVLGPNENEIDLTQYLFEYAHLALPARHVHEDISSCNQDVLTELHKHEVSEDDASKWAALKNLALDEKNITGFDPDEEEE